MPYTIAYVNNHTNELVVYNTSYYSKDIQDLETQGVTQKGVWEDKDFKNWGLATIRKWHFTHCPKWLERIL